MKLLTTHYNNWLIKVDNKNIIWLKLDVSDSGTNVLSENVLTEFQSILDEIHSIRPKGVAIISNKESGFIAGADINEFISITSKQQAFEKIHFGQGVIDKIEALPCPSIAVINGYCMGGGLELALACDYRIALDDVNTRLSLPEIQLGIHPGYGGTVRILRHVNALTAMNLMLTGRSLGCQQAKKIGLIDHIVPNRHLEGATRSIILNRPNKHNISRITNLLNQKFARSIIASQLRKKVSKKAIISHYPAPYALISHWNHHFGNERNMLQHEAQSVAKLSTTDTAKNLVRVFLLQNKLKSLASNRMQLANHVHIIGAGAMGGDIAAWCVFKGLSISLQDININSLAQAKLRAYNFFKKRLKNKYLIKDATDRFIIDISGNGISKADVVIEAIIENKEIKKNLYESIEPMLKNNAIIATNTSSIKIEDLCDSLSRPSRLVGLHFFNPVAKMPLIEIIKGQKTDANVIQHSINFANQIGKLPLPVKSSPGFLVNRILTPYMIEATLLKDAGISVTDIDQAAKNFGMPMGPLELADTVGLDVALHVAQIISEKLGFEIPDSFQHMVNDGLLGKKSGEGFYNWKLNKKVKAKAKSKSTSNLMENVQDRLILRIINEAVACHREEIVENKNLLDAGAIFGTGFAPFRGGPLQFIDAAGASTLLDKLNSLNNKFGARYKPDPGWDSFLD